MKALRSRLAVIVASSVVASSAMLVPLAAPAGAQTPANTCNASTNPASGGSQSALRVACNFYNPADVPASNVISDFANAQWHNGAARAVNGVAFDAGALAGNLAAIYSPNAHFSADDVNHIIYGTINGESIGAYTNIKAVLDAQTVLLNFPASKVAVTVANPTGLSGKSATDGIVVDAKLENSSIRAGVGALTLPATGPSNPGMVISPTLGFNSADVGRSIDGTPLASDAKILAVGTVSSTMSKTITGGGNPANGTDALKGFTYAAVSGTVAQSQANLDSTPAYPNQISVGSDEVVSTTRLISIGNSAEDQSSAQTGVKFTVGAAGTGKVTFAANAPAWFVGATITSAGNITNGPAVITGCTAKDCQIDKAIPATKTAQAASIFKASEYKVGTDNKIYGPAGTFRASDIGLPVGGCGIFAGANGSDTPSATGQNYITDTAPNGSWAALAGGTKSAPALAGCAGALGAYGWNVSIGLPTNTAPTNGDVMSMITSTLNLSASLVPGSDPCSTGTYEGTTIMGQWYNPTSIGASLGGQQSVSVTFGPPNGINLAGIKAPSNTIGGIKYPTAVVSFWAFVSVRTASETIATSTFAPNTTKITLPWVPTLLALCENTGISSEYLFGGTSIGTQSVATGTGRPNTALRGLQRRANNSSAAFAYQPTNDSGTSNWVGAGSFVAGGSLGQGVSAKLSKK